MDRRLSGDGDGDGDDDVEQFREFVVDGELYAALDLSRRLLQTHAHSFSRRAEVARLLLDRLRSNREDTADHANALLRVLANYATPTKELTEELLSLLFFCEHRVQIIHHLSKLTYQSKECVQLVLNAYTDLLSSDRSLLVPILGSLADLPLQSSDKARIVDATESMLNAASEDDVPAVVQSLLSMLVPANAPRIVRKIRSQCNRLTTHHATTLSLTLDVVLRHALAGSSALVAFLRVIRHCETLTTFDVVFLALLLARPSENAPAQGVVATLTTKAKWTRGVIYETMQRLRSHKWQDAFPCMVRLASATLATCMKTAGRISTSATSSAIQCAVDILGYLLVFRTNAQEEALSLLLSMVSQPQRLLLSTSQVLHMATAQSLCWEVAQCIATQLAHVAAAHANSLAPFAHIFLDHLYAIASSSSQTLNSSATAYPTSILESLCRTMVTLAKYEPGMVSLLMITIQKQLVVPATTTQSHAAIVLQVKQLMAVFLAGEMLRQAVGEKGDRVSLLNWVRKLLSSAAVSDETTVHVVHLLSSSDIRKTLSTQDLVASSALLASVCRRHGFVLKGYADVITRYGAEADVLPGLVGQKAGWLEASAVFDVIEFVRVARLGSPPVGWQALMAKSQSERVAETSVRAKIALLKAQADAFLSNLTVSSADRDSKDRALVSSFALPTVNEDSTTMQSLPVTIWSYVCALQYAILSTNDLVSKQNTNARVPSEMARQRKRLLQRVESCWVLQQRLNSLLDESKRRLKKRSDEESDSATLWLRLQVDIVEREVQSTTNALSGGAGAAESLVSLGGRLSLQVVSAMFEGLWKQQASTIESGLEIELFRSFPAHLQASSTIARNSVPTRSLLERRHAFVPAFASLQVVAGTQDGKRTLKYLSRRLFDYAEQLATMGDEDTEDSESTAASARVWVQEGVLVLCDALRSIIDTCRQQQQQRLASVGDTQRENTVWEDTVLELLAKGTIDDSVRRPAAARSSVWAACCEIMFKSLVSAATRAKDGDVVCSLMNVLLGLAARTPRHARLGQLSLALLHVPYPSTLSATAGLKRQLPVPLTDPEAIASLSSFLRPMPRKLHHLVYLTVGAWTSTPTLRDSLSHAFYLSECMELLVESAVDEAAKRVGGQRGKKRRGKSHDEPESEEGTIQRWIVRDGEHRVLKNLTNDTLPFLLEILLACLADSPVRAAHSIASGGRNDTGNPFQTLIGTLAALSKCVDIFVAAELSGFNMPMRVSSCILRIGPTVVKNVAQAITAGVAWRGKTQSEPGKTTTGASLENVQSLMEAAYGLVGSMELATASFQDKVVLKMQQTASVGGPAEDDLKDDANGTKAKSKGGGSGGRWGSELLRRAHGKQFQRRKALSRSEAKLLPYFTHAIEQLKVLVVEQSGIFRIELEESQVAETMASAFDAFRMHDDALETVLAMLESDETAAGSVALASEEVLAKAWSLVKPEDDDHGDEEASSDISEEAESSDESVDVEGEEDLVQEDEEDEDEEEEEDAYAQIVAVAARKRPQNQSQQVLVPQKKRIKPTRM